MNAADLHLRRRLNAHKLRHWTVRLAMLASVSGTLTGAYAHAQVLTGEIDGTVKDATGAVVPNAIVTVRNTDQNLVERSVKTDSAGQFTAPLLTVGGYSVTVTSAGFQTATVSNVQVHVGQPSAVPVTLAAGGVSQDVTVTAQQLSPQLDSAAAGTLIDSKQTQELPLSSRNYLQLLQIQPGISGGIPGPDPRGNITTTGAVNTQTFSVNGNSTAANGYFLDGQDTLKRAGQQPVVFPGVDFIQEINLQRASYGAEFGGPGAAVVSVQTKAGSTTFHGGGFLFGRSEIFNANTYFNKLVGNPRNEERQYDYGFFVGGPVYIPHFTKRENAKTFFFVGAEYLRSQEGNTDTLTNDPTAAQRTGVFTVPVCAAYAASGTCATVLPAGMSLGAIDPTAAAYLKDVIAKEPLPNSPTDPQGLIVNEVGSNDENQVLIRIDHQFNSKLSVFFRFLNDPFQLLVPNGFQVTSLIPNVATSRITDGSTNWLGHFTYVLGTNHVFEGGYAYRANYVTVQALSDLVQANSPDIQVTQAYPDVLGRVPNLAINGASYSVTGPYNERSPVTQIFLNNTNSLGKHTIKAGFNVELQKSFSNSGGANAGNFTFTANALPTGDNAYNQSFAQFLQGKPSQYTQANLDAEGAYNSNVYEGFVQDDFHATNRLTVSYGVRYSYFQAETAGSQPGYAFSPVLNFDPQTFNPAATPALDSSGRICTKAPCATNGGVPNPAYNPTNGIIVGNRNSPFGAQVFNQISTTFAPRAGFTYDVFGNQSTAIRGGYGIYYLAVPGNQAKFAINQDPPNVTTATISNSSFANPTAGTLINQPQVLQALELGNAPPYIESYSLDVQQQVGRSTIIDIGYYGNHGVHQYANLDTNQLAPGQFARSYMAANPGKTPPTLTTGNTPTDLNALRPFVGYSAITTQSDIFFAKYNSLQTSVRERLGSSLLLTASYTWSKSLTNARTPQTSTATGPGSGEISPTANDRTNVFNSSFVYTLPFLHAQHGILGHVLGGFETSGIISAGTGQFLTATTTGLDPGGVGLLVGPSTGRPDAVTNPQMGAPHHYPQWFNASAFTPVPAGQYRVGNAPTGNIVGPGYFNADVSLFKNVKLEGPLNVQLRAEAFNVLNHTNFNAISTAEQNSNFGQVTGAGPARSLQFGVKITF